MTHKSKKIIIVSYQQKLGFINSWFVSYGIMGSLYFLFSEWRVEKDGGGGEEDCQHFAPVVRISWGLMPGGPQRQFPTPPLPHS